MARLLKFEANKTYATEANAVKAVDKKYSNEDQSLRYFIMQTADGRFFPIFVGVKAIERGVHFDFHVVA
jgi:hypothetical protein